MKLWLQGGLGRAMAQQVCVVLSAAERGQLVAIRSVPCTNCLSRCTIIYQFRRSYWCSSPIAQRIVRMLPSPSVESALGSRALLNANSFVGRTARCLSDPRGQCRQTDFRGHLRRPNAVILLLGVILCRTLRVRTSGVSG
jgi:hypothetical protein